MKKKTNMTWEEEEAYYASLSPMLRLSAIAAFDAEAWRFVKNVIRPSLTELVMAEDWETVAMYWQLIAKPAIKKACRGKE